MWLFTRYAEFTYNTWTYPETLATISQIAGIKLVPVMDIEISHINILESEYRGNIHNEYPVRWHRDNYSYICALILSNMTHITGGQTLLRRGPEGILSRNPPEMVSLIEI